MHAPSYVLAPRLLVFAFAEPDHRLPRRIEEFRRDGGDLVFRQPGYRRQHLVEALIRLAVHRKARQTIHPCCRTLQREHQLSLRLLLRLGERVSAQPLARQLGVLLANRRGGLPRRVRLGGGPRRRPPPGARPGRRLGGPAPGAHAPPRPTAPAPPGRERCRRSGGARVRRRGDALAEAKQQTQGQLMLSLESPAARMYRLAGFSVYGEPYQSLDQVLATVAGLTEDEVAAVAAEFFDPARQTVVWLGKGKD